MVFCFKVKVGQGKTHDIWHCVILGFDSGFVQFVTGDGQLLISKQFIQDQHVIRLRVLNALPPKWTKMPAMAVGKLSELLIIYDLTIVSVDSVNLLNSLVGNKAVAAQAKSRGIEFGQQIANLPARKWKIREQETVNDVAAFATVNIPFDQLHRVAMNRQLLNEDHLKSLGYVVSYMSVGQGPMIQHNSPHPLLPANINELAHNVVSTVKTGLLKAATGFFWGGSSSEEAEQDKQPKDPEHKLEIRHSFKDHAKEATMIEPSPDGKYAAIFDAQNRVLLQDNALGTIIHVWKGYHHAQMGWIHTMKDKTNPDPGATTEIAILLVLYLPRRGLIEIWSPEQKTRVAHFPVSRTGLLIKSNNSLLDQRQGSGLSARHLTTAFLEPNGKIRHLFVPVHALTDRSSTHDSNLQSQVKAMLGQDQVNVQRLKELLLSAKATMSKLQMLREILRHDGSTAAHDCRVVLDAIQVQLEASQMAQRHCGLMSRALDLFEFLAKLTSDKTCGENVHQSVDTIKDAYKCSGIEANELHKLMMMDWKDMKEESSPKFSLANFMACFQLLHETDDGDDNLPLRAKHADDKMFSFLLQLATAAQDDYESSLQICQDAKLRGQDLLHAMLANSVHDAGQLAIPSRMFKFYQLCFDLQQSDDEQGNFQILLQQAKRYLIKCDMSRPTYTTMFTWKSFLGQHEAMASYAEDWTHILHLTKAFINVKLCAADFIANNDSVYAFNEVFNLGNGKIVEIIAAWLVDDARKVAYLANDDDDPFSTAITDYFPGSMNKNILSAHMCWEYCHRWSKNRGDLALLKDAYDFLDWIDIPGLQHRLARLLWNVYLSKPTRDSVNLTEIRSATRCERELGFNELELPIFLDTICKILSVLQKTANEDELPVAYDVICHDSGAQRQLVDILARMLINWEQVSAFMLFYQMAIVTNIIWHFGLDVKPLSLFSNQEASLFFQNTSNANASSWTSWAISQSRGVRNSRKSFLELACDGAVACIHTVNPNELDTKVYQGWADMIGSLAFLWNMRDRLNELNVVALYKAGQDSLGEELMGTIAEKGSISRRLIRIAILRVSKYLIMTNDHNVNLPSEVSATVKALGPEVDDVSTVELRCSANLLIALSNNDLSDTDQQSVYDWLSVIQSMIRAQN
jgi:hypothetical protein